MKPGDMVKFTRVGFNYVHPDVHLGIFLNETLEMVDPSGERDCRRYANILDNSTGEIVKTYNYMKIYVEHW